MFATVRSRCRALGGALVFCASALHAAPMGFQGSWMAMGDVSPNWQELWGNYALTARDALGAGVVRMRSDDKTRRRDLAELTYTRLIRRWNLPHAQANLWFLGGIGEVRGDGLQGGRFAYAPGLAIDYETTRVFLGATGRLYRARDVRHDYAAVRAGFSFFEAEYDEMQPWFIVEARRMRELSDAIEVTPMLRLITKSYFIEAGVNTSRQIRFNFMYIF